MSNEREPKFWSCTDPEMLTHTEIEEAIDEFLEDQDEGAELPHILEVKGYATQIPNAETIAERVLENLLENYLDDEYGDPDEYTKATDIMKYHAKIFVENILKEYKVWMCEQVCKKTINLKTYQVTGKVEEVYNGTV